MRLVKYVQFAIGLVAGGGAAIVLSGSALAAGSSLGTVSQSDTTQTVVDQGVSVSPLAPGSGDKQGPSVGGPDTPDVTTVDQTGAQASKSADQTNTVAQNNNGASTTTDSASSGQTNGPSAGVGSGTSGGGTGGVSSGQTTTPPLSTDESNVSEVTVVAPVIVQQTPGQTTTASAQFRRTVLPIQPTITNRLPLADDLAPNAPSAATPTRAPSPAKSSGMLGSLTAELAAVVVPQSLVLHALVAGRLETGLGLTMLIGLLFELFISSYGLWLRRSGFATAARSDVPAGESSPSIATPFWLGYVESPPRLHSPILVAVEMIPMLSGKEDTR